MNDVETLAFLQALSKRVKEEVDTKNPDSLRYYMDRRLLDAYEKGGVKSIDLKIGDEVVGTYSVRKSKAKTELVPRIVDLVAYKSWIVENIEDVIDYIAMDTRFLGTVVNDGEVPSGVEVKETSSPETATGTMLKVDTQKVAHAIGNELPTVVRGLLEGDVNGG